MKASLIAKHVALLAIASGCEVLIAGSTHSMEEEEVIVELTDSMSPGVIRSEGSFIHVIMPMRLLDLD